MRERGVTQTELSRLTGVPQPRLSAYINGQVGLSLAMLTYLVSALGNTVTARVTTAPADLNRSDHRSWRLHRAVAGKLNDTTLAAWRPAVEANICDLRGRVHGEPHDTNLTRWETFVQNGDVRACKRVLLDLSPDGIAMRNVSPWAGVLSPEERRTALAGQFR